MKKKGIALFAMLVLSAALAVSGCGGDEGGPDNTEKPSESGDVYQDYDPEKQPGGDSFDYDGNYASPELVIDGKGDDAQWQAKEPLFTYGKNNAVSVKAYRGEKALFFLFDVKDTVLLTQGVTNDDAVTHGDSIEFYIDTKADGGRAPQSDDFQINLGIHGKTRIMQGAGGQWGIWNGLIDYEVDLKGTLNDGDEPNDEGYTVEVMVQYKDILIEKDDTIGFAVGQVDKIRTEDAPGGNSDGNHGPWDWFGWERVRDPQVPDTYVLLQKDGSIISRDEQKKPPADLAGTVKDTEGNAVAGATAKVTVGTEEKMATTDESGYFCFEDFDPEETYTVTVEKEGYLAGTQTYTRDELRAANGGKVVKDIVLIATASLKYTTLTGTVKNVADGAVGGATITVKGTQITATAEDNGAFTIENVPANSGDITLVVSKENYADSETTIAEATLQANGTTALGDVNLSLPWADMGMFAGKSNYFLAASTTLTRTLTGIQVHFAGLRRLSGHIEFYLDTKTSETDRNNDSTAWCFRLKDDGTIEGDHYTTTFSTQGLVWTISHNDSDGFVGDFFIPYTYLGISPLEVIGVEFGQWSTSANDWDGWTNCPVGTAPVAENPTTWMRVGARNNLYRATDNATKAAFSGTVTSGGKGIAGVTVEANGTQTTTDGSGKWSMEVAATSEAVTVTYTAQGYVTATTEIAAGYLDTHASWLDEKELEERKITITGTVTGDEAPLNNVEVEILELGTSVRTNEQGVYTFENVTTFKALTVTFTIDDYATGTESLSLDQLNAGDTLTLNKTLTLTSQVKTTTLTGTVKNVADGAVGEATVTVKGTELTATTESNGTFSIAGIPVNDVDITLVITKQGYAESEITVGIDALQPDGTTEIGDVNLSLPWADAGNFGTGSDKTEEKRPMFANFHAQINRTLTGIVFQFDGERKMTPGKVELYLDTKESAGTRESDATCWRFDLNENGTIAGDHFAGGKFSAEGLEYKIVNGDDGCHITFFIPYSYLNISPTETFGISLGQWSDTASDWNGWDYQGTFVAPETPTTYRRISARNEIYTAISNLAMITLSGNAGQENVTVKVGTLSTTTDASGAWSLQVPMSGEITVTYSKQGYVTKTTTIPEGTFNDDHLEWSENVTLAERKITITGKVTDQDGAPLNNVQVKIEVLDLTAMTDESGEYTFENVTTFEALTLTFTLEDYADGTASLTLEQLNASDTVKVDQQLILTNTLKYTTLTGTVKNVADGAVGGATVTVKGTQITATTSADGTFTLGEVPANTGAITLVVTKEGYAESEMTIAEATLQADGTTALGEVNLSLPWADMGKFAGKSEFFVEASTTLTRTLTGIQIRFNGTHKLSGRIEVYLDTQTPTDPREQDSTAWRFDLKDDGTIGGDHYAGGAFSAQGLVWTISHNDSDGFTGEFFIPYTYLEIGPTEVFGIEFGQWSTSANGGSGDWDGWTNCPVGTAPVAENPTTWMRVGARNNLYRATDNATKAAFSGTVTAGGKGIAGVVVSANGTNATTDASGKWSMDVPVASEAVTVTYTTQGYQTATTTIEAGYFNDKLTWSEEKTLEEHKVTISGKVTDQDGHPIHNVEVEILELGTSVKTNEQGEYTFEDVTTFVPLTVKFSLEGYAEGTESLSLEQLNAGDTVALNKTLTATTQVQKLTLTGKIIGVEGGIEGATIKLKDGDDLATTTEDGTFSIENFTVVDCTLVISKAGYLDREFAFSASAAAEATGSYAIAEDIFLTREYGKLGEAFATNEGFASFVPYVTRGETAFEFKFVGSKAFQGFIEFFVDTKGSSQRVSNGEPDDKRNMDDYRFNLTAEGGITVKNWGGPNTSTETLVLHVEGAETTNPVVTFTLPYAFLKVERDEIIGVTFGQSNNGWDGWNHPDMKGFNGIDFVAPEMTMDYIRIGVDNKPFENSYNYEKSKLDLSEYPIHFAQKGDSFYAKVVKRDQEGVTFEFVTLGNFGEARQGEGTSGVAGETEMVILYFDTDNVSNTGGWTGINYMIKIFSNGTVYGKANNAWWSATDADKTGETVTITRENGVTKFQYTVKYTTLGIDESAVFGVAMREASHGGNDHRLYDPWYDCFFNETNFVDAAAESQYIRVKADGTLATANSNAEVN